MIDTLNWEEFQNNRPVIEHRDGFDLILSSSPGMQEHVAHLLPEMRSGIPTG